MTLDLIGTLALAGVALALGYALRRFVPTLARYNVPAPILGGLVIALAVLVARQQGVPLFAFDTALQRPLMIAFFTTIGFTASLRMMRSGGPLVLRFFLLASGFAVLQNMLGIGLAAALGLDPLFGVLAGSVTLAGGPATGLAFAPMFEQAGVPGAESVAVAVAMGGIVLGGLVGGPVATWLLANRRTTQASADSGASQRAGAVAELTEACVTQGQLIEDQHPGTGGSNPREAAPAQVIEVVDDDDSPDTQRLTKNVVALLVAMWLGGWLSAGIEHLGLTLPSYIGAMLVGAAIRNIDDATGWFALSPRFVGEFGAVTLALFLSMAIMTLKLWELAGLAVPIVIILIAQVLLVAVFTRAIVFRAMGRDYEAAVMSGGFVGFMLGTTANAMAVMRALVERYGPAPTAFLVAPMVGAFFIDFANALVITGFYNVLR
jgi:glutamate:Na+ symporter, ESS family